MLNVALIDSDDPELQRLLADCGGDVTLTGSPALATLAQSTLPPDLLVIDTRGTGQLPQAVSALKRQHPSVGVLIVAASLDPSLLLEAMRAGVSEVVTQPITRDALDAAITRVLGQRPAAEAGRVFAFVGAKGGVGTTTAAVNIATALGAASKPGRTLLIDLHLSSGDAAVFLGAEPRFSTLDALENTHRLDATFFRGLVVHAAPGLDLLAASERAMVGRTDPAHVRQLVEFAASNYRYVVLDVPRSDAAALDALDSATTVVIVANQELATVRGASRLAAAMRQRYGRDRVSVVVSRSDRQADIGHADVERAIGTEIADTFPSDYRLALQALHKGRPLALDNHNELSGAFKRFAFKLAGIRPDRPAERTSGLLGLFAARR